MGTRERTPLLIAEIDSITELFDSHDSCYKGLNDRIDAFEDIHSPDPYREDGRSRNRMYGPSSNPEFKQKTEFESLIRYIHTAHFTYINSNGAFMIVNKRGDVLVSKPGADGEFCPR